MLIFFFRDLDSGEREREEEKERDRLLSRFHTVSTGPDVGLELTNCEIMT